MAIAGDAAATDPACIKSPLHASMTAVAKSGRPVGGEAPGAEGFVYRRIGGAPQEAANPARAKPDPALIA
jgi:pyrroloquinoline quinone biosynthesis protein E